MKPKISLFWSQIDVEKPNAVYIQARYERGTVAQLRLDVNEGAGWIGAVYVHPDYRGKGLASTLLGKAYSICRQYGFQTVGLTVHENNDSAKRLYQKQGFLPYTDGHEHYQQLIKVL